MCLRPDESNGETPDKAVNAHLAPFEIAVCILTLDEQNCGFKTCLVAVKKSRAC